MQNPKNRIVAFLWHQGESDANQNMGTEKYKQVWTKLINYIGREVKGFNPNQTPIFIGQMVPSWIKATGNKANDIDRAHKLLASERKNTYFISATKPTELGLDDEKGTGFDDNLVHYSATSQRQLGKRYFNKYQQLINTNIIKKLNPSDYNADNKVDIFDYNILVNNFGNLYTIFDYNELINNYGK
jgi:hypothetical protein